MRRRTFVIVLDRCKIGRDKVAQDGARQLAGDNVNKRSILSASLAHIAIASTMVMAPAGASQFTKVSRTAFGPSLNKDAPSSSGPAAVQGGPGAQGGAPAGFVAPAMIMPTMPISPAAAAAAAQPATLQPLPPATSMERAASMTRSVMQKVDPEARSLLHRDSVDLNRPGTPPTVNGNAAPQPPANANNGSPPPTVANAAGNTAPANSANPATANAQSNSQLNTSMNKQEKKVSPEASREVRQLQRGILNEQKMNVGTIQ